MLSWIDESAWMAAARDFPDCCFVTRAMDKIDFKYQVKNGSILRIKVTRTRTGVSSVTYPVKVYEAENTKLTLSVRSFVDIAIKLTCNGVINRQQTAAGVLK